MNIADQDLNLMKDLENELIKLEYKKFIKKGDELLFFGRFGLSMVEIDAILKMIYNKFIVKERTKS